MSRTQEIEEDFRIKRQVLLMLSAALLSPALAQVTDSPSQFEVASIRTSGPGSVRGSDAGPGSKDPGRFTYGKAELLSLILYAYQVNTFQVQSRIPLDRDQFDVVAKVPEGATKEDLRAMLRNFLADRFHLKTRVEKRDLDSAVLVAAPGGLKMGASGTDGDPALPRRTSVCEFRVFPAGKPGLVSRFTTRSRSNGRLCCSAAAEHREFGRQAVSVQ